MHVVKHIHEANQNLSKNNGCFGSCRRSHSRPSWKTSPKVGVGATTMKLHDYGRASFLPLLYRQTQEALLALNVITSPDLSLPAGLCRKQLFDVVVSSIVGMKLFLAGKSQ